MKINKNVSLLSVMGLLLVFVGCSGTQISQDPNDLCVMNTYFVFDNEPDMSGISGKIPVKVKVVNKNVIENIVFENEDLPDWLKVLLIAEIQKIEFGKYGICESGNYTINYTIRW